MLKSKTTDGGNAFLSTPVYLRSSAYARAAGELGTFRASLKANIACKEAIEKGIRENYANNCMDATAIYDDVVGKFGTERVKLVLAATIRHKDWDERFSRKNRAWATTVRMQACFGAKENDHSLDYVVESHSCLTDLFVTYFRENEQERRNALNRKKGE